jgi:histone H3/H4
MIVGIVFSAQKPLEWCTYLFSPFFMIVQSHVKEVLSKMGLRCGGDFCDALAKECEGLVKKAASRCKENKRQTVYGCDC